MAMEFWSPVMKTENGVLADATFASFCPYNKCSVSQSRTQIVDFFAKTAQLDAEISRFTNGIVFANADGTYEKHIL